MKSIKIFKNTSCNLILYAYDNFIDKNPIDLSVYKDIKFNILDYNKSLLFQKSISQNSIILSNGNATYPYIINISISANDTKNLFTNDQDEEILRYYYLIGISNDGSPTELDKGIFYLNENYVY